MGATLKLAIFELLRIRPQRLSRLTRQHISTDFERGYIHSNIEYPSEASKTLLNIGLTQRIYDDRVSTFASCQLVAAASGCTREKVA